MIFTPTPLEGVWLVELERHDDDRGWFARTWCRTEFDQRGLDSGLVQCSMSHSGHRGTLRGMHWQTAPHREVKLVRCTRGAIWDVVIDMRPGSPTFTRHYGVELSGDTHRALYIPPDLAHGFVTLEDDTEVFYQMTEFFAPESARGVRWNDPAFGIEWPVPEPLVNERDASYPDFALDQGP